MQNDVLEKWAFASKLGAGGFGEVQLWRSNLGNAIAIKICLVDRIELHPKQKQRWLDEVAKMNELKHPNIVATKPVPREFPYNPGSLPALGMEYCRQGDLRQLLNKTENSCGLLETDCIRIMSHITDAVEYLHSIEITHRDLKPENIVLQEMNNEIVYKLIDLGYAKTLGEDSICASRVGTLHYIAPELLMSEKYSCSVDYWSLGILFYEIITGRRAFVSHNKSKNPLLFLMEDVIKKSYQDISVTADANGAIKYQQNIQEPNNISPCIKNDLVRWFRIVLQWNPKKRGRSESDENRSELVVFTFLKEILSSKVIRIFCVPSYTILTYKLNKNTTLQELCSWIESDTGIEASSQELINASGGDVKNSGGLQLHDQKDKYLTLFKKRSVSLTSTLSLIPPDVIQNMIESPQKKMERHELRVCYLSTLFFINSEVERFRLYVLALSTKMDFIISRYDTLKENTARIMNDIRLLWTQINIESDMQSEEVRSATWQNRIFDKLRKLSEQADGLETQCDNFLQGYDDLKTFPKIEWFESYQNFSNKAQKLIDTTSKESGNQIQPAPMCRIVLKFLAYCENQLRVIGKDASRIEEMLINVFKLDKYVESITALIKLYQQEFMINIEASKTLKDNIQASTSHQDVQHINTTSQNANTGRLTPNLSMPNMPNDLVSSDNVIYDNCVIRYLMHDLMVSYDQYLLTVSPSPYDD